MIEKNDLVEVVKLLLISGEITYEYRSSNSYLLSNERYSIYLNLISESISIEYLNNTLGYLDKHNIELGFGSFTLDDYYSIYEIIVNMVIDDTEINRVTDIMNNYASDDDFENASKIRDIITEIKEILNII